MNIYSLLPVLITALIGFVVYRYRNQVGYSVTTVSGVVPDDSEQIKIFKSWGRIKAEKLKLRNYGLRNLENVELHLVMSDKPFAIEVGEPTTLSKKSVKAEWNEQVLTISLASFPSKEEIAIDVMHLGHYEPIEGRLKGTGGKYKIVRIERYEVKRQIFDYFIIALFFIVPAIVSSWLESRSTTPKPIASSAPASAPASTR